MLETLFVLIALHYLGDFPLQNSYMAQNKARHGAGHSPWYHVLTAHAFVHGLFVYAATGCFALGLAELAAHWLIDFAKGERKISYMADQSAHIACKLAWAALATTYGTVWWLAS